MMDLSAIIAELEGAAQQEAAGIAVLETTRFEPALDAVAERCIAAARRRAEGLAEAARLLRAQELRDKCAAAHRKGRVVFDAVFGQPTGSP